MPPSHSSFGLANANTMVKIKEPKRHMPPSHNGIASGLRPEPFWASPFDSGWRRSGESNFDFERFRGSRIIPKKLRARTGVRVAAFCGRIELVKHRYFSAIFDVGLFNLILSQSRMFITIND